MPDSLPAFPQGCGVGWCHIQLQWERMLKKDYLVNYVIKIYNFYHQGKSKNVHKQAFIMCFEHKISLLYCTYVMILVSGKIGLILRKIYQNGSYITLYIKITAGSL